MLLINKKKNKYLGTVTDGKLKLEVHIYSKEDTHIFWQRTKHIHFDKGQKLQSICNINRNSGY